MKYPHILAEMDRTTWLITGEALDGLYRSVDRGLVPEDYAIFHGADRGLIDDLSNKERIAVRGDRGFLFVDGPIVPRDGGLNDVSGLVSIQTLTRSFQTLLDDDSVSEIALVLDSPGGAVNGVSDFARLIESSPKPVDAFVLGMAASAAYWIASASRKIYSVDTGMHGSIGVVSRRVSDPDSKVREIVSTQSPNKRPDLDTPEGKAVVQEQVDDIADVFIDYVAKRRGVGSEYVIDNFGKGGLLIASKALHVGMIDGVMTMHNFLSENFNDIALDRADKNQKPAQTAGKGAQLMTLKEFLADNPAAIAELEQVKSEAFAAGVQSVKDEMGKLTPFLDPNGVYPKAIRALAFDAISGSVSVEAVRTAIAVFDGLKENEKSKEAQEESADLPPTPAIPQSSVDTENLKTAADVEAALAGLRALDGGQING